MDPRRRTGPLEGQTNYLVRDPKNPGRTITDIERFTGNILWEEKSATWAMSSKDWVAENITAEFARYVEARQYLPESYGDASIGFRFDLSATGGWMDPQFQIAVEAEIKRLMAANPEIGILLEYIA